MSQIAYTLRIVALLGVISGLAQAIFQSGSDRIDDVSMEITLFDAETD